MENFDAETRSSESLSKHRTLEEAPEGGVVCFFTPAYSGKEKGNSRGVKPNAVPK